MKFDNMRDATTGFRDIFVRGLEEHDTALIYLHGLGGTRMSARAHVQDLFPDRVKDNCAIVIPQGNFMWRGKVLHHGWYNPPMTNTWNLLPRLEDALESAERLGRLMEFLRGNHGITRFHIAGFSQGGTMAMVMGLLAPEGLESIGCFAGYIPRGMELYLNKDTPVKFFWSHGTRDAENPYALLNEGEQEFEKKGVPLVTHSFPGGHTVAYEGVEEYVESSWTS